MVVIDWLLTARIINEFKNFISKVIDFQSYVATELKMTFILMIR